MLFDFNKIREAAKDQNGWQIRGIYQLTEAGEHRDMATGIVVFERPGRGDSGTAAVNVHPNARPALGTIEFYWGHYDLSMVQSREDFTERIAKGG